MIKLFYSTKIAIETIYKNTLNIKISSRII